MSTVVVEENGTEVVRFCGPEGEGDRRRYEITSSRPLTRGELRDLVRELIDELDDHGGGAGCAWCGA